MKLLIFLLVAALPMIGCTAEQQPPPSGATQNSNRIGVVGESSVDRIVDDEYGVVCYVSDGSYSGGISCLPINKGL